MVVKTIAGVALSLGSKPGGDSAPGVEPVGESRRSESSETIRIEVPGLVFVHAVITVLITFAFLRFFIQVLSVCVLIGLSLILAAVLAPLVSWLERHRFSRGLASLVAIALVVLVVLALLGLVVPPMVIQGIEFVNALPSLIDEGQRILERYPDLVQSLEGVADKVRRDPGMIFSGFLRFGLSAATTIFAGVLLLTLTLYFLTDEKRIRAGVLRLIPDRYRSRFDETLTGVATVVRAFFAGQAIISSLFAVFTFILLTIFGVPYAVILAALAFFLDAIPNIGSLVATVLPTLLALTQSVKTAIIVFAIILVYNQIEANLLSPRILGDKLKVPPVLTMIAILIGGALFGIVGIILAIPLAGTAPVIERIWTRDRVVVADGPDNTGA